MPEYKITVNEKWCKNCGICAGFCPKQVLFMNEEDELRIDETKGCIGCRMCEYRCPQMAITVDKEN